MNRIDESQHHKDIAAAEREFEHLVATGQIVPDAVWLAQASRTMFELAGALYARELKRVQASRRLSRVQAPFMGLDGVQHLVTVEVGGWARFAFLHEDADPKVSEWWRMKGRDVVHLLKGADRIIEVAYPLLEEESPSKRAAFQRIEADGGRRMALVNLSRAYLDALVVSASGQVAQIARFSNPLRGVPVPGIDLTKPTRLL